MASPVVPRLCDVCWEFDLHSILKAIDRTLAFPLAEIASGAEQRCEFCRLVHDEAKLQLAVHNGKVDDFEEQISEDEAWVRLSASGLGTRRRPGFNKLTIVVSSRPRAESREKRALTAGLTHEFCIAAEPESPAYQDGVVCGRYLGEDRSSAPYLSALKAWIDGCRLHQQCCTSFSGTEAIDSTNALLPTRCLEVTKKSVFLRETRGTRGSYITLSHRWNSRSEECRTTTGNYAQRTQGRGLGNLAKIFDDAITVALSLGIPYLWIDSLCIIQDGDNGADWEKESTAMAQYYQNALFNIAAIADAGTNTEDHGFLGSLQMQPPFKKLVWLPYRTQGMQKGGLYVYKREIKSDLTYFTAVKQSDLMRRGWVFQEWLLSRRIVYYTPYETFMECQSFPPQSICNDTIGKAHDLSEDKATADHSQDILDRPHPDISFKVDTKMRSGSTEREYDIWYLAVTGYSATSLTFPKDHIIAIAGLAIEISKSLVSHCKSNKEPRYFSGLWLQDIHHGLLWRGRIKELRSCSCGAPSWSWAACLGPVQWPKRDERARVLLKVLRPLADALPRVDNNRMAGNESRELRRSRDVDPIFKRVKNTLIVTGVVQSIFMHASALKTCDTTRAVATLTDSWPESQDLDHERAKGRAPEYHLVSATASKGGAGGWAVLDMMHDKWEGVDKGIEVLVLQVQSRTAAAGQTGPRILQFGRKVCDVLLLERAGSDNRFFRIGVGCVSDPVIMEGFKRGEEVVLELI